MVEATLVFGYQPIPTLFHGATISCATWTSNAGTGRALISQKCLVCGTRSGSYRFGRASRLDIDQHSRAGAFRHTEKVGRLKS